MTNFLTISPTHISGKKPYSWEKFKQGNYVALGWGHTDYTNWSIDQIIEDIKSKKYLNESEGIDAHRKFYHLEVGDVIAPNNVGHGLFGIGIIKSDYKFKEGIHDTGSNDATEFYSHYREVEWVITDYQGKYILAKDEKSWRIRGTVGGLFELPEYIRRLFNEKHIPLPTTSTDIEDDSELIGYEGKVKQELKLHKWIERDRVFRNNFKKKYTHIQECNGCQLNPLERYGIPTIEFLELHHLNPLALRKSDVNTITKEADVVLLCPNCHKLIHKMMSKSLNKIISLKELKNRLNLWIDASKYHPNYINGLLLKAETKKKLFEEMMKEYYAKHPQKY